MEYSVDDRAYCLAVGDMAVLTRADGETRFPTGHYHGVTVTLDPARAPDCLSCFLEDVDVRPQALMDRYCRGSGCFVARSSPGWSTSSPSFTPCRRASAGAISP